MLQKGLYMTQMSTCLLYGSPFSAFKYMIGL